MKLEIMRAEPAFDGVTFGDVGPYEKIVGRAFAEVDPSYRLNAGIVNLARAPHNAAGRVEYCFDFYLLKPVDLRRGSRRIFYDVNNRGNKLALNHFNDAPRVNDPSSAADAGNGFLMRQGHTLLWSGWQGDVTEGDDRLLARLPIATDNGAPIVAVNRDEFIFEHDRNPARALLTYPANTIDERQATLTVRQREQDQRLVIPPGQWRYVSPIKIEITRPAAFDAGAIYEFIYPARDPIVMGLGFAAVRDFVAFMRHESADADGTPNPLNDATRPAADYVLAYGASQSGRFLRDFLWQGFNEDLGGRKVFDGVIASVAGSRKTFVNFAFAQPGRFSRQHEDRLFPGDQFPFSYATTTDPISGRTDGILARCQASDTCPKIMQTEGSTDFWQGRAGLLVTDGKGNDIPLPDDVRLYLFASIQHGGGAVAANFPFNHYPANPAEYSCVHRALLAALDQWVSRGTLPPPSRFPRASDGTLVSPSPQAYGFPAIPGVTYPGLVNELAEMDYSVQPPRPLPGRNYIVLVPATDEDGNESAGVRVPEITVARGTHTGWNLRRAGFAYGDLVLLGSHFPFAATKQGRLDSRDPRPSLEERYPTDDDYLNAIARAADELRNARLLLAEDVERIVATATAHVRQP
ncbi:MAG TPA: alpha/beta hydrolase domain-containing protein [Candidatus Binataceae bacterium]|nr:alpha/beta hydrolase domain-containing protein [Candidatus Binataceae bacterium]